nr:hypothetical protein [Tanacetum cinerariifolium]
MLKQEFLEFSVSEEEGLHKGYDRFQKILSQLNQMQAKPDNNDVNMKFLRALTPSWSQVALTLKTRGGLKYLSFDDLYNRLRSLKIDVKGGLSYGSRGTTVALTHSAFIGATSTNTKMVYSNQPSHSFLITYTSAHFGSIMEDVLYLFVAENEPTQQLAYEDFKQAGRKINFNNKDPARFDRRKNEHEAENKTKEGEQVYGLMAGFKSNFADHAGNAAGSVYDAAAEFAIMGISPKAKIKKKEWEVKLVKSLARTKLGLGFKEYIGLDEVFVLYTPSVFDLEPKNREVKSLYERFVKAGEMHEVAPSITGTFMPTSDKSDLEETQVTFGSKSNTSLINTFESNYFVSCDNNDKSLESKSHDFASCVSSPKTNDSFSTVDVNILPKSDVKDPSPTNGFPSYSFKENVKPPRNLCIKSGIADRIYCQNNFVRTKTCFVCGSKSHLIKDCDVYDNVDNFPSVVLKATSVPAGSRNYSVSTSAGRSVPAASRNRPASVYAGRHIPAGRFNKPAPFPTDWYRVESSRHLFFDCHVAKDIFRKICRWWDVGFMEDETFYILKDFIALIKNQLNKKVKAIRYDNRTEFQNVKLIDLYGEKGIKRDYSNAKTPQQNSAAERKNRTLIEAARSMVSITNPHNKTPYELLSGKAPNISHLKPFGCQVTILNTSDHLGKFKGKANKGFLVGYAANSKAYSVYNLSSKKVEETLNLRYLEDKLNVQGLGQEYTDIQ